MLLSRLQLGLLVSCTSASVDDDETTLLQLGQRSVALGQNETVPEVSVAEGLQAMASANTQQDALIAVETMVQRAVKNGLNIDDVTKGALESVKTTLTKTSEKVIKDAHTADDKERKTFLKSIESTCGDAYKANSQDDAKVALAMEAKATSHKSCRNTLANSIGNSDGACKAVEAYLQSLQPPNCQIPAAEDVEGYINSLEAYVGSIETQWPEVSETCAGASGSKTEKAKVCANKQAEFESAFCSYRQGMYTSCAEYRDCYNTKNYELAQIVKATDKSAGSRKLEWSAVTKIKCYIDVLLSKAAQKTREGTMETCKNMVPNTKHLDLSPITAPEMNTCDLAPVWEYPCTETFTTVRYAGLADIQECTPCAKLPEKLLDVPGHEPPTPPQVGHNQLAWNGEVCKDKKPKKPPTPTGRWQLAMNLNTRDGNVVWYGNNEFWESEKLGGATDEQKDAFVKDYKDVEVYKNVKVKQILIMVHENGQPLGWRIWNTDGDSKGMTLMQHFQKGSKCTNGDGKTNARGSGKWHIGKNSPEFDEGCLTANEPMVKKNDWGDKRYLYINHQIGNDPNRMSAYWSDYGNEGAGLGTAYDVGSGCDTTQRPQSDAQMFNHHHHWQKGLIGKDTRCYNGVTCEKPPCGSCPWTYPSGYDYDYAIFVSEDTEA